MLISQYFSSRLVGNTLLRGRHITRYRPKMKTIKKMVLPYRFSSKIGISVGIPFEI